MANVDIYNARLEYIPDLLESHMARKASMTNDKENCIKRYRKKSFRNQLHVCMDTTSPVSIQTALSHFLEIFERIHSYMC